MLKNSKKRNIEEEMIGWQFHIEVPLKLIAILTQLSAIAMCYGIAYFASEICVWGKKNSTYWWEIPNIILIILMIILTIIVFMMPLMGDWYFKDEMKGE